MVISMNLFRFVYIETYQRGIPIYRDAVRYTACAFMKAAGIFQELVNINRKLLMEQL
jgi:hypothetical protein